jgi:hypothetical protein
MTNHSSLREGLNVFWSYRGKFHPTTTCSLCLMGECDEPRLTIEREP